MIIRPKPCVRQLNKNGIQDIGTVIISICTIILFAGPMIENSLNLGTLEAAEILLNPFLIDTNLNNEPTPPYAQYQPAVAFDGTNYLVVWLDAYIWGARVTPTGVVLDTNQILISTTPSTDYYQPLAVAFDGSNYLVVWVDIRDTANMDIYGARVTPTGVVLDPNGIRISSSPYREEQPSIAFDGTNYLVVWVYWVSFGYEGYIYGARVTPAGVVLDPNGIPISTAPVYRFHPSVAFDGTNYLVVWDDARNTGGHYCDIYGARVTPNGTVLDPGGIEISGITSNEHDQYPTVAFGGTNYLVVWQSRRGGGSHFLYSAVVSPNGTVIDTNHYYYDILGCEPQITFTFPLYTVTYTYPIYNNNDDICGLHIDTVGNIIDTFYISNQNRLQCQSALTCGPNNQVLITYSGWTDSINHQFVNRQRIWGIIFPELKISENRSSFLNSVFQAYPNPFTNRLDIRLTPGLNNNLFNWIDLHIYDVDGRLIKTFALTPQISHLIWSGVDEQGTPLPPGLYFIVLRAKNQTLLTKKIIKM